MVDVLIGTIAYFAVTLFGGFLSSWMSFNASGEAFNPRKHGNALITGALSGLGFAVGNIAVEMFIDISDAQLLVLLITAFFAAFGIDRMRSDGNQMIANNSAEETKPPS